MTASTDLTLNSARAAFDARNMALAEAARSSSADKGTAQCAAREAATHAVEAVTAATSAGATARDNHEAEWAHDAWIHAAEALEAAAAAARRAAARQMA